MASVQDIVKLVHSESDRLKEYLGALPQAAWGKPSACDRWTVADVVAHLVWGAEMYTDTISRGVRGDTSPPPGARLPGTFNWEALNNTWAEIAIARRKSLGDRLLTSFNATTDYLNRLLASLAPEDWEKQSYHPLRLAPIRIRAEARLVELVFHGWDIRSRLEPAAHLSAESLVALREWGPRVLLIRGLADFRLSRSPAAPVRYRFDMSGAAPARYDIIVEADSCRMEPAGSSGASVTLHCDTEAFMLLAFGRLSFGDGLANGQLVAKGDSGLVNELGQWFKGN